MKEPTFDADGYPTEETIQTIINWQENFRDLMAYLHRAWTYKDYFTIRGNHYMVSTGGWSGNEELMAALRQNLVFWALHWKLSKRGGHFEFEIPTSSDKNVKPNRICSVPIE